MGSKGPSLRYLSESEAGVQNPDVVRFALGDPASFQEGGCVVPIGEKPTRRRARGTSARFSFPQSVAGQDGDAQGSMRPPGRRGPGAARGWGPTADSAHQVRPRAALDALSPGLGFLESGDSTGPVTPFERMTQARDPSPRPALSSSRIQWCLPWPREERGFELDLPEVKSVGGRLCASVLVIMSPSVYVLLLFPNPFTGGARLVKSLLRRCGRRGEQPR